MKVYYAHGGGYTELGGMKTFLLKINGELSYERVFPAVEKKPKPKKKPNKMEIKIKSEDSGVSGTGQLFKKLLEKLKKKKLDGEEISILVVIDDTDCRLSDEVAYKQFLQSVEDFKRRATEIYKDLKIIFIWVEPEIEKWFCLDMTNCFPRNKPCGDRDFHRKLFDLLEKYSYEYDFNKDSCSEKFSEKFKEVLNECGLFYSKRNDGSEYLKKVNPSKIEEEDKFAAKGIRELKNLYSRR